MELFESLRSTALSTAIRELSQADAEGRGAVYTRIEVVRFVLDLSGYESNIDLASQRLLEPSFGAGEFVVCAIERLFESFDKHHGRLPRVDEIANAIRAVELHQSSFVSGRERILATLHQHGLSCSDAVELVGYWLIHDDFLLSGLEGHFTHVVGNPPYVRQELIPDPLLREYRRLYKTIYDRADLYIPFIERGLALLEAGGALTFICSDRWMKNRYGGPLRSIVASGFNLRCYVDMVGTPAFEADVSAYPAIFVIAREAPTDQTVIVKRPGIDEAGLRELVECLRSPGRINDARIQISKGIVQGSEPWLFDQLDAIALLRRLEREFLPIETVGCPVGIGVATGADAIFIRKSEELPVEESRKLPILTTRDVKDGKIEWTGRYVLNPFESAGGVVELAQYPLFAEYVNEHAERIKKRHVAKQRAWYRTIDRIYEDLTWRPKLLIPDIAGRAHIIYDDGHYYPHHNFYFVTSTRWHLRALQTVLRSTIAEFFVAMYCVKMRGGYLRFQAQYIRRIRLPEWEHVPVDLQQRLVEAADSDRDECDRLAFELYGLTPDEASIVRTTDSEEEVPVNGN